MTLDAVLAWAAVAGLVVVACGLLLAALRAGRLVHASGFGRLDPVVAASVRVAALLDEARSPGVVVVVAGRHYAVARSVAGLRLTLLSAAGGGIEGYELDVLVAAERALLVMHAEAASEAEA
jgi:hypothetical protein